MAVLIFLQNGHFFCTADGFFWGMIIFEA